MKQSQEITKMPDYQGFAGQTVFLIGEATKQSELDLDESNFGRTYSPLGAGG